MPLTELAMAGCRPIAGIVSARARTVSGTASSRARSSVFSRTSLPILRVEERSFSARLTARASLAAKESAQRESDRRKTALSRSTALHRLRYAGPASVGLGLSSTPARGDMGTSRSPSACRCRGTGAASAHATTAARAASLSPIGMQVRTTGGRHVSQACIAGIGWWSLRPGDNSDAPLLEPAGRASRIPLAWRTFPKGRSAGVEPECQCG